MVLTCILAFGLLIPFLGFYQDDWHPVYYGYSRGLSSLWELFLYDGRPFAAGLFVLGFRAIGYHPLHWHLVALALRSLTVLFTWMVLSGIWPEHKRQVVWSATLFAVYPLFKLQPLSLIYSLHWTGYLLFAVSIWAMVQAVRRPKLFWPFSGLALLTGGLHLLLLEYFAGVELARPVILWLLLRKTEADKRVRLLRSLTLWLPYLALLVAFGVYRVFFLPGPDKGSVSNNPTLIYDFLQNPLAAGVQLLQFALQDTTAILFSAWGEVIRPELFDLTQLATVLILVFSLVLAATAWFFWTQFKDIEGANADPASEVDWYRYAFFLGLLLTVLGPIPAWATGQSITGDNPRWSDRFGLASMAGASLVTVAVLEALVSRRAARTLLFSSLLGLAIGWHVLNANDFRRSWIKQTGFYQQLAWRAPYIEPGTAIFSDGEIFSYMGDYPTSFALGTLYPKIENTTRLNYYFFSLSRDFADRLEDLVDGIPLRKVAYSSLFLGYSRDSLVIFYEPESYECLWVLRPEDQEIRVLPDITREVIEISNLNRIQLESPARRPVPAEIFGPEPKPTWCYYFEKADLARQFLDWERVVALWGEAAAQGLAPGNGVEMLPFIEGFARQGEWEMAVELSRTAQEMTRGMSPILCATWRRMEGETPPSAPRVQAMQEVFGLLECTD